jgi:Double-GTPase 2
MEDLFVVILGAIALGIAVVVALGMVAASASISALVALFEGARTFAASFGRAVAARGGARRRPRDPEPAFELYVLGQLLRDMQLGFAEAWAALQRVQAGCMRLADRLSEGWTLPIGLGAVIGGYAGMVLAAVLGAVIALPIVALTLVASGGAWLLVGILRAAEALRRRVRRAGYECPVDHERFALPIYVCPACGAEHRQLVPGRWGIVRRECRCGAAALPTMVLNGRQRVPQQCPSGHPMSGLIGFAQNLGVAIVAGPRAGKSTYLAAALLEFEGISAAGRLAVQVLDESRSAYDVALGELRAGTLPRQTTAGNPALVAEVQGDSRSRVLYAYDVTGESYRTADELRGLRFLETPAGLVLLVDPLALPQVAQDYAAELGELEDALRPSPDNPMRVLERTAAALAESGVDAKTVPVAVVVGKIDAFDFEQEIQRLESTAGAQAPRAWLEAHGAGNLVRAVEHEFKDVGWFASTSLGRIPQADDRRPFQPRGASAPLLWLLGRNGVKVAERAFEPARMAERLAAGGAADFQPIAARGWAWRIGLSALALLLTFAALAAGIAALVPSGGQGPTYGQAGTSDPGSGDAAQSSTPPPDPSDSSPSSTPSTPPARPAGTRSFRREAFSIALPAHWRPRDRDVEHDGYVESTWHPRGHPEAAFLVDDTIGSTSSARDSANQVRRLFRRVSDYRLVSFAPVTLGGHSAWAWVFDLGAKRKVDYFIHACDTGYAMLGEVPRTDFERYRDAFQQAASALTPVCEQ